MLIMHGSAVQVPSPEIRASRFAKDFGAGFYCSIIESQAYRWATRFGNGYVNYYEYSADAGLNALVFPQMTEEWLDFIAFCRNGGAHEHDIVEGPMANDEVYNYVEDFMSGAISRTAFWELVKFRYPTHQISFHTEKALHTIRFVKARLVK